MLAPSGQRTGDDSKLDVIKRRAKPHVLMLDAQLNIAYAEPRAIAMIANVAPLEAPHRLPAAIETAVRAAARRIFLFGAGDDVMLRVSGLLLHLAYLRGADGTYVSLLIEEEGHRDNVRTAAKRYALTRRESEVLSHILKGESSCEIAESMCLANSTIHDYLKALIRKTASKNRSDMIAKVLDFTS